MKRTRKPTKWNLFVKKIYNEGKRHNSNYEFKNALIDASKRKSEMNTLSSKTKNKYTHSKKRKTQRHKK